MRRTWLILACTLGLSGLAGTFVTTRMLQGKPAQATRPAASGQQPPNATTVGIWQPPSGLKQIPIWPNSAPDMAGVSQPAESVLTAETPEALEGRTSQLVYDVSSPTMTIFPPKGRNSGAAIIVFPGGGFNLLAITGEGTEICHWIASKGITCILSKYRVPNSNHHYDKACDCGVTPKVLRAL